MHPLATQLEALGVQLAELSESLDARQESRHDLLQQALSNITHSLHRIQAQAREESE
jgi:ABC-type Fe2+-enterobactin transport system substrate-binding protein